VRQPFIRDPDFHKCANCGRHDGNANEADYGVYLCPDCADEAILVIVDDRGGSL